MVRWILSTGLPSSITHTLLYASYTWEESARGTDSTKLSAFKQAYKIGCTNTFDNVLPVYRRKMMEMDSHNKQYSHDQSFWGNVSPKNHVLPAILGPVNFCLLLKMRIVRIVMKIQTNRKEVDSYILNHDVIWHVRRQNLLSL